MRFPVQSLTVFLLLLAPGLPTACSCGGPSGSGSTAAVSGLTSAQIDSILAAGSTKGLTVTARMMRYSELFLGMGYNFQCVGDGPYALSEAWPLVNLDETNCMSFCEHVLAMAISDSWDNFFNNLQQIRYRDGIIGMRTRNHYTMADWLPENDWLLDDVSALVGGGFTRYVTRTISHRRFFAGKGITDMRHVLPDRELTVAYVPEAHVSEIEGNLRTGDIGVLLVADKDDIFSHHMTIIAVKNGRTFIRESTSAGMSTFDTPYKEWIAAKFPEGKYIGMSFIRVRDDLNTPDRIILPWKIAGMKEKVRGR